MTVIDSCIWIAAKREKDKNHVKAKEIVGAILNDRIKNCQINDYIFNECVTFLLRKHGSKVASEVGDALITTPKLRTVLINGELFVGSWAISKKYGISLTDASIAVMLKDSPDNVVYSFDSGFDKIPWVARKVEPP